MIRRSVLRLLGALSLTWLWLACVFPLPAHATGERVPLMIWARVLFGTDGRIETFEFVSPRAHRKAFLDRVQAAVAQARIPVQQRDGVPASFKTGMRIAVVVDPSPDNPGFRIASVQISPILLVEAFPVPDRRDLERMKSWTVDTLAVSCTVQTNGRCKDIRVEGRDLPDVVRQFGLESAQGWRFEPQEVGEQPIESTYVARLNLRAVVLQ